MRLHKPPDIPAGPLLTVVAIICRGAEVVVVILVLPGLSWQLVDGGVERGQNGAVGGRIVETARHGLNIARKPREDVDAAVAAHDI
ncbi:hypothetical protein RRF57_010550 [Xylaria bambusicola]|uniref:Uncharacterized protein n=1 Tax=Xylaria bambusicola TaxID=326684 RepID=A0AAN7Z9K4_9PEZI